MDGNGIFNPDKELLLNLTKGSRVMITYGDLFRSTGEIIGYDKNGDLQIKLVKTNGISTILVGGFLINQFIEGMINRLCFINF